MGTERRSYTKEFKQEAVQLWQTSGKSARQVEEDLGITSGLPYKWKQAIQEAGKNAFPRHGQVSGSETEIRALRRELAAVKEERDILKKAVAIFSHPKS